MPAASIAADLKSFLVPIDSVQPHPENARRGDVPGIAASLKAHGQYAPILVQRSTGFIVAGNHTWRGAKRNKWDSIAALHLDVSDEQALEILLVDNRLNDLAGTDQQATLAILNELESAGRLTGTGYSAKDLADLRAEIGRGTYRSPDAGTAPPDAQPPPAMSMAAELERARTGAEARNAREAAETAAPVE